MSLSFEGRLERYAENGGGHQQKASIESVRKRVSNEPVNPSHPLAPEGDQRSPWENVEDFKELLTTLLVDEKISPDEYTACMGLVMFWSRENVHYGM